MRRGPLIAACWLGAVAAAVAAGVASIGMIGGTDGGPLSQREVAERLATTPPPPLASAVPGGSTRPGSGSAPASDAQLSPGPAASGARQYYTTTGGSLWATCSGGIATLDGLSPRSGFRIDGSDPGPGEAAWVKFKLDVKHGHGKEYVVTVSCSGGVPRMTESADE